MNIRIGAVVALLAVGGSAGFTRFAAPAAGPSISHLSWLAGCFEMRSGDRVVEEYRMGVRAGSMLGMARTTTATGLGEYELTLIQEREGKIVFEARPSGQPPAMFTASTAGPDSVVFAAPEHGYPQFVGYRSAGADSVIAWIDGKVGGTSRRIEFPYRRVACGVGTGH